MIRAVILTTVCVALSGCGFLGIGQKSGSKRAAPEAELPFRAKTLKVEGDILNFSVAVVNNGEGVEAVRESVRFQGTQHCLYNNGSTDIVWQSDEETGDWAFVQDGDTLVFQGRCVGR